MDKQLQTLLRQHLGLRVDPAMAAYIARHVQHAASNGNVSHPIPVIAADARTGVPRRLELSPTHLRTLLDSMN